MAAVARWNHPEPRCKANLTMSSIPTAQPAPITPALPSHREIRVYSHSPLFYWWPVWFVGFLMAVITYFDPYVMAVVPKGTVAEKDRVVPGHSGGVEVLVTPPNKPLPRNPDKELEQPRLHMSSHRTLGVVFSMVLLIIIVISNVPMHGLWSVIVLLFIILVVVIAALIQWGEGTLLGLIVEKFSLLDVRINMGGYFLISLVLFIIWAITVFVFDHRKYVAVTPGQVRVCQAIGTGED